MRTSRDAAQHAAELHRQAIVIDCHNDILSHIADGLVRMGKPVTVPGPGTWQPPFEIAGQIAHPMLRPISGQFGCVGQYSLPQFLAGGVTAAVCAVCIGESERDFALRHAMEMVAWFYREAEENDALEVVTTAAGIRRAKREGKCGAVLAFESAEQLGYDLTLLPLFHRLGLRMCSLTHFRRNAFADGRQDYVHEGGLTQLGKDTVRMLNELHIVVDLSHINQVGFWESLEISKAPVVVSHRSALKNYPRRPEDSPYHPAHDVSRGRERLEALAANGGVFGVFFYGAPDVDYVVDDIEYAMDVAGEDHVGIGSDFWGLDKAPAGLEEISRLPAVTSCMVRRGHTDDVIVKLLGGNLLRVFEQVWGE
jgi:membrane dipeptidase